MGYSYAVLGAGRQGVAAAYDMVRFGEASRVMLADADRKLAEGAADRINQLLGTDLAAGVQVDVTDAAGLAALLEPVDAVLSAVPYRFNLDVTRACIASGTHMNDLGGNTDVVWAQLALDDEAKAAGVSIIPDCGLQPGMGNTMVVYGMEQMSDPAHAIIWVGGLPLDPRPPFDYLLSFNLEGVTNEYDEPSIVIKDGKRVAIAPFELLEPIMFPDPVGQCEAFLTTGGTSTCPWTFEGKLQTYIEKTVRYPGHAGAFKAFRDLGLFGRETVQVGDVPVVPRELYHTLLRPLIDFPDDQDVIVLRVKVTGQDHGREKQVVVEMIDFQDPETGFRAMERTTGWPAAIVTQMMARGQTAVGAGRLELAVPPTPFVAELQKRQFDLTLTVTESGAL